MQLRAVDLEEVLEQSRGKRGRPRIFTDEDVTNAVRIIKDGIASGRTAAVLSEGTYQTKEQARSHALKLRDLIVQSSDLADEDVTTKVWLAEEGAKFIVYYKTPIHT